MKNGNNRGLARGRVGITCAAAAALCLAASAASAQQPRDGFEGTGAALCIAAGERLAAQPGAAANIADTVAAWRQILHVVDGTEAEREGAVATARAALAEKDTPADGATLSGALWAESCAQRGDQVRYVAMFGAPERIQMNLADAPGAELDAEEAERLRASATCLVGAELFSRERSSDALRAALRQARPAAPGPEVLRTVREQARREIDGAPGSAIGRELLVDFLRYLFEMGVGSERVQNMVNGLSAQLNGSCGAKAR
jgi:hypothetical protein